MDTQKHGKGLRGRAREAWLRGREKERAKIRAAYKCERSLAIVAELFKLTRGRVSQIVNSKG